MTLWPYASSHDLTITSQVFMTEWPVTHHLNKEWPSMSWNYTTILVKETILVINCNLVTYKLDCLALNHSHGFSGYSQCKSKINIYIHLIAIDWQCTWVIYTFTCHTINIKVDIIHSKRYKSFHVSMECIRMICMFPPWGTEEHGVQKCHAELFCVRTLNLNMCGFIQGYP